VLADCVEPPPVVIPVSRWWPAGGLALEGAAVGCGHDEGVVGEEFGVPAGGVEEVVVAGALQGEVVEGGGSAVEDPAEVVGFGPGGGSVAAGEAAVAVADDQGVEQVGGTVRVVVP
jgi:hypothetical protein